jgi:hypothetical protein
MESSWQWVRPPPNNDLLILLLNKNTRVTLKLFFLISECKSQTDLFTEVNAVSDISRC